MQLLRRVLAGYFLVVFYSLTLSIQLVLVVGEAHGLLPDLVVRARVYVPAVVAVALTFARSGLPGIGKLLLPLLKVRIHFGWYLFALLYAPAICIVPVYLLKFLGILPSVILDFGQFENFSWGFLKIIVTIAIVEEIAWVSTGIENLRSRYTLLVASLIGGALWGLWYLPLNVAGIQVAGQFPNLPMVVNFASIGALTAWLYVRTKSAAVVALMQVVTNYASLTVPVLPTTGHELAYYVFLAVKCSFVLSIYLVLGPKPLWVPTTGTTAWGDESPPDGEPDGGAGKAETISGSAGGGP